MDNLFAKETAEYFDSKGINYDLKGENKETIITGFSMKCKESQRVDIFFYPEKQTSCSVKAFQIIKDIPRERIYDILVTINKLNSEYRWVKFSLDMVDMSITAADDCVIVHGTCGEEVYRAVVQMLHLIEEAYPLLMETLEN